MGADHSLTTAGSTTSSVAELAYDEQVLTRKVRVASIMALGYLAFEVKDLFGEVSDARVFVPATTGLILFAGSFVATMWSGVDAGRTRQRSTWLVVLSVVAFPLVAAFGASWVYSAPFYVLVATALVLPRRNLAVVALASSLAWGALGVVIALSPLQVALVVVQCLVTASIAAQALRGRELVRRLRLTQRDLVRMAVDVERLRFSRDVHDLLGHDLSVMAMQAELVGRLVRCDPTRAESELASLGQTARQGLRDVRLAVSGYRALSLSHELTEAVRTLSAAGIRCEVTAAEAPIPPYVESVLAWVVREGSTNVLRHSRAQVVTVRLTADEGQVGLDLVDHGAAQALATGRAAARPGAVRGTAVEDAGTGGSGLRGMRERVAELGGTVEVRSRPDGGFSLHARIPVTTR